MKEPHPKLKPNVDKRAEAPNFDTLTSPGELVRGDRTRDDFFDAVLGLNSPATASEVAELADRGVDAAREYLEWFERMGIVTQLTESPATYERNQSYLNWRRVQRLREEYTTEELLDFLKKESKHTEVLAGEFEAETPSEIPISKHAAATDQSIEEVWERLSSWKTARRRVTLLERALTTESGDGADLQSAV
ncbi:hypothetical protein [Halostagnicola sp. A-GB9-2]|uniref:DUF7342 family protein n=1 Tax=Halostagnicola sp. A-GB9-2 TaxID=3048066 RepID=UPI0024BF4C87|nr:hypothetical protein [Halostagnicola sp. A-GB9-2]MDJ1434617.1 hypothetical protein [Halostagnicola sp. A-GB9-2]